MEPIRIVQIVTGLAIGDQVGGAELFAAQLARCLDKNVFNLAVLGLWEYESPREAKWIETLQKEQIRVKLLATPTDHLLLDLRKSFSNLWRFISDFKPDIINSHSERTDTFNMLASIFHPTHPLSIRTMHTDEQWQNSPWMGKMLINGVFPFLFEKEIAISEDVRQLLDRRLLARLKKKESILCYNGIDVSILNKKVPSGNISLPTHKIPEHIPRIGIIGRLTPQKGHSDLLKAMRNLLHIRPAHLLIVGSGPLEDQLKQQTNHLGLHDFVHFLGSRNDVLKIMTNLDLVVSSSLWEGFPTVLLEAMAMRVPIVATDVSGSRELVNTGETGILVPPHNPAALAEAILKLLDNPSKAQLMARNAREVVKKFTIQNTASCYAKIYKRIVR
jgi:glycosyltransferase involved in cell wall biosynthesis